MDRLKKRETIISNEETAKREFEISKERWKKLYPSKTIDKLIESFAHGEEIEIIKDMREKAAKQLVWDGQHICYIRTSVYKKIPHLVIATMLAMSRTQKY